MCVLFPPPFLFFPQFPVSGADFFAAFKKKSEGHREDIKRERERERKNPPPTKLLGPPVSSP